MGSSQGRSASRRGRVAGLGVSKAAARRLPSARRSCRTTPGRPQRDGHLVRPARSRSRRRVQNHRRLRLRPPCDAQNIALSDSSTCSSKSAASDASTTDDVAAPLRGVAVAEARGRAPHTLGNSSEHATMPLQPKTAIRRRGAAPRRVARRPTDSTNRPTTTTTTGYLSSPAGKAFVDDAEVRGSGLGRPEDDCRREEEEDLIALLHLDGRHERRAHPSSSSPSRTSAREHHHANAGGVSPAR